MYLYVVLDTRVPNEDISLYKVQRATVKAIQGYFTEIYCFRLL